VSRMTEESNRLVLRHAERFEAGFNGEFLEIERPGKLVNTWILEGLVASIALFHYDRGSGARVRVSLPPSVDA
jgi:uncharacterized protein YndB with AHSA1/START domain